MDERELLILNPEPYVWQHKDKDIALPFTVSKFFFDIDGGFFQIKEGQGGSGARRFPYLWNKITLKIGNGAIEGPFPNEVALLTRLRQVKYPGYYYLIDAMGLISTDAGNILAIGSDGLLYVPNGGEGSTTYISDGENTNVTGTGTSIDPYQINVPDVGGSQNLQQVTDLGNTTTNPIIVGDLSVENPKISLVDEDGFDSTNTDTGVRAALSPVTGLTLKTISTGQDVSVKSDNVTITYVAQMPDKSGSQTFAMLSDLGGGGSGTVTDVSVVTANGVTGSVANSTTTPEITLSLDAITPTTVVASGNVTAPNIDSTNKTDIAARELLSNKSDNDALGSSTSLYPTQRATKVYSDNLFSSAWQGLGNTATNNSMVLGTAAGSNFSWSIIRNGASMLVFNNNAIGVGGTVFFTGANAANNGQLGIGSTTTALSYSRNLTGSVDLSTYTDLNSAATGRLGVWRSNIGGTTADRVSILKTGQVEISDATAANQAITKGQVDAMRITVTSSLNFPSVLMNQNADLTVTVTGAAVGDVVALGLPNSLLSGLTYNVSFLAWVSSANTVTVRFQNNDPLAAHDFGAADFKITVLK